MTPKAGHSAVYAWYVAALLTLTQIVSYTDRFLPSLLVQPMKAELHLSDFQMGLLLGPAFVLFYITLGLPIGWLADRFSRRAILAAGITIWCAMTALGAAAGSFLPLFATRLGVGLGEATVTPSAISLIGDYFPRERRARALSLLMSGTFLGAGSAFLVFGPLVHDIQAWPPVAVPLLGAIQSWRLCFFVIGIPGLALALLMLTVREPTRRDRGAEGGKPSLAEAFGFVWRRRAAFGTLFIASGCNLTLGALAFWNVALFKRNWDWNVADTGRTIGIMLFTAGPIGTLIGIGLTNRWIAAGRRDATLRVLLLGLAIGVPAYAIFPLAPAANFGVAALFCAHIGQAMATAAGPATLMMLVPGRIRAQSTAIYYLVIGVIGQMVGPPLVGGLSDLLGDPSALRYAIALEVVVIGIPSIVLVLLGFAACRGAIPALDSNPAEGGMMAAR
jgi:MFS family permease